MSNSLRPLVAVTVAAAGMLAAISLSVATAGADPQEVTALDTAGASAGAVFGLVPAEDVTTYTILPDPEDGVSQLVSIGGISPFDTTAEYAGAFTVNNAVVIGYADYYSDAFGLHNVELDIQADSVGIPHGIIDQLSYGSGWENVYTDFIDSSGVGPNTITDTLITPFGDFNIPTTFDAVANFPIS